MVGLVGILVLVLLAVLGPYLLPWGLTDMDSGYYLSPPSWRHPLGTTQNGRDMVTLTAYGLGRSLFIGFVTAILQTAIASVLGATAAYFGKLTDKSIMWVIDLFQIIPSFLIIGVVMKGYSNPDNGWIILAFMLAAWGWMMTARVVRALSMSLINREYVKAARYVGLSAPKIIFGHILPNISSLLIVDLTLGVAYAILSETGLTFLGIGIMAPATSLGTLIKDGSQLINSHLWIFAAPATVVLILALCVNAVGDGLRDALDPNSLSGGRA